MDLKARREGVPLWQLLSHLSPQEIVDLVDFRHLADALTPQEALSLLERAEPSKAVREAELLVDGYPAYTTSAGWLGYSDDKVSRLVKQARADGFAHLKMKVGRDLVDDRRRLELVRGLIGPDVALSIDANQVWDVQEAIDSIATLSDIGLTWVEEPTSPDDILGHRRIAAAIAPLRVATGEHVANRVLFKQLLQMGAIGVCQIDACRVAGVNENIAILLLAAKYGVPVCPHAGGVGLCETVQHLSMFDYVAVSASLDQRWIEYVDHLHEHFTDPARVAGGRYVAPVLPGASSEIKAATLAAFQYPDGQEWRPNGALPHQPR